MGLLNKTSLTREGSYTAFNGKRESKSSLVERKLTPRKEGSF
jgi:hypothetical protein